MTSDEIMRKAERALASAKLLSAGGDADGACNRAYYAIFDAARAALQNKGIEIGKTHSGVITSFSQHFVLNGPVPKEIGRLFKQAEARRYVADYENEPITLVDAEKMIEDAELFLSTVRALLPR